MSLDPKHLLAIEIIRREGGLTRAAKHLHTSQPALSRLVSDIEIRLNAIIFDRSERPWRLTKLGQSIAAQGALVLRAQNSVDRQLEEFRSGTGSRLRIVGPQFFTESVVSQLLIQFSERNPDATFDVAFGYGDILYDKVRNGQADLAFVPHRTNKNGGDLLFTPLRRGKNVVACRSGHPILQLAFPRPLALLDYGWIMPPSSSPLAEDLKRTLSELDMHEARVVFSGGSFASVTNFLENSDCLTILPELTINALKLSRPIEAVPIKLQEGNRMLGILSKPIRELDQTSLLFMDFSRSLLADTEQPNQVDHNTDLVLSNDTSFSKQS
ncbi:MAG: LysR family transcriptional regulator [Pseudomonadota bacterium]